MEIDKINRIKNNCKYVLITGFILFIIGIFLSSREACKEVVEDGKTTYVLYAPYIFIGIILLITGLIFVLIGFFIYIHYYKKYKIASRREINNFNRRWE